MKIGGEKFERVRGIENIIGGNTQNVNEADVGAVPCACPSNGRRLKNAPTMFIQVSNLGEFGRLLDAAE